MSLYRSQPIARQAYAHAKWKAKKNGIPFKLTFEQWYQWWLDHGVDKDVHVPRGHSKICMVLKDPAKGVTLNNMKAIGREEVRAVPVKTPMGTFKSITLAAKAHGIQKATMDYWTRTVPALYKRLK